MNKLTTLAAAGAIALSSQQALAEGNNTSPEFNQDKVEVVKKSVCDKTNLALACHKAGLVLPQEKYVENQNNIETAESMIDFSQLEKSSDIFSDVMFPNKDQLFMVSEDTPAELKNISDIRELYSNILMSRSTDRSPAWDTLFEKLELSEDKNLFIDFINQAVKNIKENHGDVEGIPTNVPQIYLEKSITASISALLNMPKEQTVVAGKVSEFTLRYLTDLTTALYLKGDIQESDIQVINNNGAYFATFDINEQTVSTLIDATQGKYSPLAVLQSMKTVGENLQEENIQNNPEYHTIIADYKTFFKSEKIADKYIGSVANLSIEDQKTMYQAFNLGKDSIDGDWKAKQRFVLKLFKIFEAKHEGNSNVGEMKVIPFLDKEAASTSLSFQELLVDYIAKYDKQQDIKLAEGYAELEKNAKIIAKLDDDIAKQNDTIVNQNDTITRERQRGEEIKQRGEEIKQRGEEIKLLLAAINKQ